MSTPRERLEKLIAARTPSEVVFRVAKQQPETQVLAFTAIITKAGGWIGDGLDAELKAALITEIEEAWNSEQARYSVSASVDTLWSRIKHNVIREYESFSNRCAATKRKTELFIRGIHIDDKHLPNYLVQVFLVISSPAYSKKTRFECETLFEQFEALRRTYGKRS